MEQPTSIPPDEAESIQQIRELTQQEINALHTLAWQYFQTLSLPHPKDHLSHYVAFYDPQKGITCSFRVETTPPIFIHLKGPHNALNIQHTYF